MKLENKRNAQARRAKERTKKEQQKKFKRLCLLTLIVVIIAIFIVICVSSIKSSSSDTSIEETETSSVTETANVFEVSKGDTVNIDYVGYIDGVEFNGGNTNGEGVDLEIGSGTYIDGFEDQLVGHEVGDSFDITVTFPDDYGDTTTVNGDTVTLSGADVVFTVRINSIVR